MSTPDDGLSPEELMRHSAWLRRLAYALAQGDSQAEDLVQDTWLRYVSQAATTGPTRSHLARILYGLSRHTWRSESRRKDRERAASHQERSTDPPADEALARLELSERLVKEVGLLKEHQRTAVLLRYFDDLNAEQIAERVGVPAATVRSRLKRGLDELRRRLDTRGSKAVLPVALGPAALPMRARLGMSVAIALAISVGFSIGAWPSPSRHEFPGSLEGPGSGELAGISVFEPVGRSVDTRREVDQRLASAGSSSENGPGEAAAPFAVQLVVHGTELPLASYWVRLVDDAGNVQEVESDENGRVQSPGPWPAGTLEMHGIEHPAINASAAGFEEQVSEHVHTTRRRGEEGTVGLRVGPTIRFATVLPVGTRTSDFFVELRSTQGSFWFTCRVPLRGEDDLWARFPAGTRSLIGDKPWRLTVGSRDGYWSGTTIVGSKDDDSQVPVPLCLENRGRLSVQVLRDGAPMSPDESGSTNVSVFRARSPSEEAFEIYPPGVHEHVDPGEYELVFSDPRHLPVSSAVVVTAGETAQVVLEVQLRSDLAPVAGILRSVGEPLDFRGTHLSLWGGPHGDSFLINLTRQVGPSVEVPFRFDPVPPGQYALKLWSPKVCGLSGELEVEAGSEGVVFPCEARGASVRYPVAVRARESGEPLLGALMTHWFRDSVSMSTIDRGWLTLDGVAGRDEHWMISAHGYTPWWGSHSDLDPDRTTIVELVPGWGAEIHTRNAAREVHGSVEIFLDGDRFVGVTDEEGRLRVTCTERPETIDVDPSLWEVLPGGDVRPDGVFNFRETGIVLCLRAQER